MFYYAQVVIHDRRIGSWGDKCGNSVSRYQKSATGFWTRGIRTFEPWTHFRWGWIRPMCQKIYSLFFKQTHLIPAFPNSSTYLFTHLTFLQCLYKVYNIDTVCRYSKSFFVFLDNRMSIIWNKICTNRIIQEYPIQKQVRINEFVYVFQIRLYRMKLKVGWKSFFSERIQSFFIVWNKNLPT
jgi:hypothetical protein